MSEENSAPPPKNGRRLTLNRPKRHEYWLRLARLKYDFVDIRRRYLSRLPVALLWLAVQIGGPTLIFWQAHPGKIRGLVLYLLVTGAANALLLVEPTFKRAQEEWDTKKGRKMMTAAILDWITRRTPPFDVPGDQLREVQGDALRCIVSCVSASFQLPEAEFIASLQIASPDSPTTHLRTIARSCRDRPLDGDDPKEVTLAHYAMLRDRVEVTGDLSEEYEGIADKPYRSVLSLPIHVEGTVVGAVSVDHPKRFLFHARRLTTYQDALEPYLMLLAFTLHSMRRC